VAQRQTEGGVRIVFPSDCRRALRDAIGSGVWNGDKIIGGRDTDVGPAAELAGVYAHFDGVVTLSETRSSAGSSMMPRRATVPVILVPTWATRYVCTNRSAGPVRDVDTARPPMRDAFCGWSLLQRNTAHKTSLDFA
jgi:hypothetical protein